MLFDTPWDTAQFQPLLDSIMMRHQKNVIMCLATHSHEDRTGGLDYYKHQNIKTYTTKYTDQICQQTNQKRAENLIVNDTTFTIGQYTFQTYFAGAGHTPDNIVIWVDKEKILYGGCLIKSTEAIDLGNLNDAKPDEWFFTLERIKTKFGKPTYIIPGHQSWSSNKSIEHTQKLIKIYLKKNRKKGKK
ncbi:MAG: subclass B1 metallo-beta-lactamase [Bacteroidetes bacterium]|nr:subclass B1 metallo-beta-lactamase [Bacteroidota bacterium]